MAMSSGLWCQVVRVINIIIEMIGLEITLSDLPCSGAPGLISARNVSWLVPKRMYVVKIRPNHS